MAPPPTPGTQAPPLWTSFVPLALMYLVSAAVFAVIILILAPRKGRSQLLALLVLIPCFFLGPVVTVYLLSLTDKQVLDDIQTLKQQLASRQG